MEDAIPKNLALVTDKLSAWGEQLILMLPNIFSAVLVMALFWGVAAISARVMGRALGKEAQRSALRNLTVTTVRLTVIAVGLVVALQILNLDKAVVSLLAGVGVIGLALGFAFQDIAANFMAGVLMAIRRPLATGDLVESNGVIGKVLRVDLRNTVIRTFTGQDVLIPNKDVFQTALQNYTASGRRRVDLKCGISYGDDLEKVERVVIAAIEKIEERDKNSAVELFFAEFGASSIDFTLRFWLNDPEQPAFLKARHAAIKAIKKAFNENSITIPFPIRTLDFGIKGGVTLAEQAPRLAAEPPDVARA